MSLKKNLVKNGVATGIQKLIRTVEQLILVPFFLSAWGAAYYGEWITLTAIPAALALSDFGLGSAAANAFVIKYASGDKAGAVRVAKAGFISLFGASLLITSISAFTAIFLSHTDWIKNGKIDSKDAIWVLILLIFSRALGFFIQLLEAFYRSGRKAATSINALSVFSLLKILAIFGILRFNGGIVVIALSDLIITICFLAPYSIYAFRIMDDLPWNLDQKILREFKPLFNKGIAYLASPIWQSIFFQGTTLVVRGVLGAEMVAIFNTLRTLCRSVNQMYSMISGAVFPELQMEFGAGRLESSRRLFRASMAASLVGSVIGIIFLWLLGPKLYQFWTHGTLSPPRELWCVFLVGIVLNALWSTAGMIFRASNKPEGFAFVGVFSAFLAVVLSWWWAHLWGVIGAALGSLVLEIAMLIYVLPKASKIINQPMTTILRNFKYDLLNNKFRFTRAKLK